MCEPIARWALENYSRFQRNGFGRFFGRIHEFADAPAEVESVKREVMEAYGIRSDATVEPFFAHFCGVNLEGAAVHEHRDSPDTHTRFNVMVQKPEGGGHPVIDGVVLDVPERGTWRCNAGLSIHSSTPVQGSRARVVLSFGFTGGLK